MTPIRKALGTLAATLFLALGIVVGPAAVPASAHHTHSPTTFCLEVRPGSSTYLRSYVSRRYASGHPWAVVCVYRDNRLFRAYWREYNLETHALIRWAWCNSSSC